MDPWNLHGLAMAEVDPVTDTRETDTQYNPQLCHPTDGELRDGVDSLHQNNIPKSDSKRKRKLLSLVRLMQILQAQFKRTSAPHAKKDLPSGACSLSGTSTSKLSMIR